MEGIVRRRRQQQKVDPRWALDALLTADSNEWL